MILVSLFVKFLELLDDEDFLLKLKLKEKEEEDFEEAKKLAKKIVLMEQEERIKFLKKLIDEELFKTISDSLEQKSTKDNDLTR